MVISNWKMKYEGVSELACTAPCSMYSVLYENKIIDDPFYGTNDREYSLLSKKDCTFSTEFDVTAEMMGDDFAELVFYGLDTICDIYLNGKLLDSVKNMHRTYLYDVKKLLKEGKNTIILEFKSPMQYFEMMDKKRHVHSSPYGLKGAGQLRKTLCMSGWDWGPCLPDMGIYRPVCLNTYNTDRIEDVEVLQHHKDGQVTLEIKAQTKHASDCKLYAAIDGKRVELVDGRGFVEIENPKLWWVRGYGEQPLYELTVELECDGKVIDTDSKKIGLRTLTVSTEPDDNGSEFCIVINGVKIFAMGANYIPQDSLVTRTTPEKIEEKIKQAVDANFNCMRVWGGGYYPSDEFFDCCDRYGLIVWQDFLFACMDVYLRDEWKNEVIQEAICNVRRIRHHASLGILCGNNEMEDEVKGRNNEFTKIDYLELFEHILADISEKYAPQTFYWCASPSSGGGFDEPNSKNRGDTHYWEVWHAGKPFNEYRKHSFRFCSEYGFESFPSIKTIKSFCEEKDMNCFSRVIDNHQKFEAGNAKIIGYLADNYLYPYSFENLVYTSQLLQADAIKYGVEHFRRQRGYCMGSVYWQFNDCWPVVSWSSVDYYGRYKALHYAAKKFYAPVAMGLFLEKNKLSVNVSNETMNDFNGKIKAYICTSDFEVKEEYIEQIMVDKLTSEDVFCFDVNVDDIYNTYIYVDLFDENDNFIMRQLELLTPPKYYEWKNPEIELEFTDVEDGVEIAISAKAFAKGVYVDFEDADCKLSDNFVNITNREKYVIKATTELSAEELKKQVKVKSVYDIPNKD